jgi:iron complex outermembrane receptor protein
VNLFTLEPVDPAFDPELNPLAPAIGDVTNEIIAPYVIDHMKFSDSFQLVLGARYDNIDVEATTRPLLPEALGPVPPTSFSRDDSEVSPMLGIVVAPDPSFSIYANAAESYAPPSTRQVDVIDPADREPQRGRQIELGVKKQFMDGKVRTTFAAYNLERDRIPITDETGFTASSGDQRSRGLEIELAAEPLPRLRTFFSYAYNDAELTEFSRCVIVSPDPNVPCVNVDYTGNTPIMAPEHLANLWVSKSFEGGFGVAGGVRYVDEQFISEDNQYAIESSVVVDAAFFYDRQAWRFKLNLKNVSDEEYELRGIAGASSVIPADPFAVYAGVEFRVR